MLTLNTETFVLRHVTAGRVRVQLGPLRPREDFANALEIHLQRADGVKQAQVRRLTSSLIVFFDPRKFTVKEALKVINETALKVRSMDVNALARFGPARPLAPIATLDYRTVTTEALKLAAITVFLGYSLVRSFIFHSPLREGVVVIAAGLGVIPLSLRALRDLFEGKRGALNMFLAATCALAIFSGAADVALEIIWIAEISRFLGELARDRSRRAVQDLLTDSVRNVFLVVDGVEVETSSDSLLPGDIVSIRKGDRIPVDGEVESGEAMVNVATYTGRAEPDYLKTGDKVFNGMIVVQGKLQVRAEKTGRDTQLAQTLAFVEKSLNNRAHSEQRADQLAEKLTKLSIGASILTFILTRNFGRALGVQLVMACPCATALAASTAVTAALTNATRNKVLIKGGLFLEKYAQSNSYCFDKTGALSEMEPAVSEIYPRSTWIEPQKIALMAASAEGDSGHPVAVALKRASLQDKNSRNTYVENEEFVGRGVRAKIGNDIVMVGNLQFMIEQNVNVSYFKTRDSDLRRRGLTVIYVARNDKVQGILGLGFKPRKGAKETIEGLKNLGVKNLHIISGDSEEAVSAIAEFLGIHNYLANALPDEKARYVQQLQDAGKRVVMVGDGINDAPAMSKAWVGVAMGREGSEIAITASDITLSDSNLLRLVELRRLGMNTFRIVDQNYYLAVGTDIVAALMVATGALTPLFAGLIHLAHVVGIFTSSSRLLARSSGDLAVSH
ncbi:MAG: cation-translocating P-type ATPase [Deltaproteobacteria bacterium]|nr:cation-translocating P-type ATPase [Deltaproteobacteria bacterium]